MKKKLLGMFISLLVWGSFCGCGSKTPTEGLEFSVEDGTYVVTGYSGKDINVIIPDTYNDVPVTMIAAGSFEESEIQTIQLGENIEVIESGAFAYATLLKEIHIPKSVITIGVQDHHAGVGNNKSGAFKGCINLKKVTFDKNSKLETIGFSTFDGCESLTQIKLPNSVAYIGYHAFAYCKLIESIDIPETVSYIGRSAFKDFTNHQTINILGSTDGWMNTTYSISGITIDYTWSGGCEAIINYK